MKHILFLLPSLLMCWIAAMGQQAICPPNGISTNPDNPRNPQLPQKVNRFDWRTRFYKFNYKNREVFNILSPFWDSQNNITDPVYGFNEDTRDYSPRDGWELIAKEFGYEDDEITPKAQMVSIPILILYNKYTGLMRAFCAIKVSDRNADYNGASIQLRFKSGFQSSLLQPLNSPVLDFEPKSISNSTPFINQDFKWFYADFQMTYDPCTCQNASTLEMEFKLTLISNLTLNGLISGRIQRISPIGVEDDDKKWSFSRETLSSAFNKAKSTYKSISSFSKEETDKSDALQLRLFAAISASNSLIAVQTDIQKKKADVNALSAALGNNTFLKDGLKAAPYLGAALSFLEAFISGGKQKEVQEVKMLPMSINADITMNGNISTVNIFDSKIFALPGSKDAHLDLERYPYYNEVLGVLNVLEKPRIKFQKEHFFRSYALDAPVRFVMNPAAGFKANPDVRVAYVIEHDDFPTTQTYITNFGLSSLNQNNNNVELFEREGLSSFRSPYFPIELL